MQCQAGSHNTESLAAAGQPAAAKDDKMGGIEPLARGAASQGPPLDTLPYTTLPLPPPFIKVKIAA